tara:strand:- start:1489 stop:2577 length:1089 start_codon:yes stop_codon:yes gene_type:complete
MTFLISEKTMKSWSQQIRKMTALIGLGMLLLCVSATSHAQVPERIKRVESTRAKQLQALQSKLVLRAALLKDVRKAASHLSRLKQEAKRPLLGIPARFRLSSVRAKAHRLAQKLEAIDKKVRAQKKQLAQTNQTLRRFYKAQYKQLSQSLKRPSLNASQKARLLATLKLYKTRYHAVAPTKAVARGSVGWKVRIDPLDGPGELKDKARLLKDFEDRTHKRLKDLQGKIARAERRIKRAKKDAKLAAATRDALDDDLVFQDQGSNPRAIKGAKKNQRQFALSAKGPSAGPTKVNPRVGGLSTGPMGMGFKNGFQVTGTPTQQLEALKRYKKRLKIYLQRLQRQQKKIIKRAKELKAKESRRAR